MLPLRQRVVMVETIGQNGAFVYEEIVKQQLGVEVVCLHPVNRRPQLHGKVRFVSLGIRQLPQAVYYLATSRVILVDNYVGLLAGMHFRPAVICIQLWHAAGAIKKFGLEDGSVASRTSQARARFQRVYAQFHRIVVGSDAMANIFEQAFGLEPERMLRTGIPRTDLFWDEAKKATVRATIHTTNPALRGRRVILYAPTYRDEELDNFNLQLDLGVLQGRLGETHVVLLRLHPAIRGNADVERQYPGFVFDYSRYPNINELLLVTDVLITDYSSVVYEYAILERPVILYPYDLDAYQTTRGLWDAYRHLAPGPIVHSTVEIAETILQNQFDFDEIRAFSRKWNTYSTGQASRNLVEFFRSYLIFDGKGPQNEAHTRS